ncbi:MAG: Fic family protein [Methanotrichaceae archaeon]|nr:Fic family protein [Methanotrichaceae archaeon]
MKKGGHYDASSLIEAQFEPGSRGRVLRNLLGIKSKREMDQVEAQEQLRTLEELVRIYDQTHRFTAADVRRIHKIWLGSIYAWAGNYRQVNLSKVDFPFAAANQIPRLMIEFEKGPLREYTPCRFTEMSEIARAIAVVHTELLLIHPFREGNGRVARLLAVLMALQAGLPPLDFGNIKGRKRQEYFRAVQAGLDRDYKPMEEVFSAVIRRTRRVHGV